MHVYIYMYICRYIYIYILDMYVCMYACMYIYLCFLIESSKKSGFHHTPVKEYSLGHNGDYHSNSGILEDIGSLI